MQERNNTDHPHRLPPDAIKAPRIYQGIAVSNVANDINPGFSLPDQQDNITQLARVKAVGIEIQYEGEMEQAPLRKQSETLFLGLHQPIRGLDPLKNDLRVSTRQALSHTMNLAQRMNASYAVFHLQTQDYWDSLQQRPEYTGMTMQLLESLLTEYTQKNFTFDFLVENLEYPKFPSTKEEIAAVLAVGQQHRKVPFGIGLDVGHLWRSGSLLKENIHHPVAHASLDEYSKGHSDFSSYLSNTTSMVGDYLRLIHITGCSGTETHLLPGLDPHSNTVVFDREYAQNELDVHSSATIISQAAAALSHPLYVVNEAHGYSYEKMIVASQALAKVMEK